MISRCLFAALFCFFLGCTSKQPTPKATPAAKPQNPLATLEGNVALDFSPDGKWLAVGAELIDTSSWTITAKLEERVSDKNPKSKNHWGYTSAAFSPDSKHLVLGDQDGTLRILDVPSMVMTHELLAHGARITGIGFAADNETIVTTSVDDFIRLRVWNMRTDQEIFRSASMLPANNQDPTTADIVDAIDVFALSPNRELFAAADVMSKIVVGRVQDGKVLHSFKGPQGDKVEMDSLAFTGDSNKLWIGVTPNIHVQAVNGEPAGNPIATKADSTSLQAKVIPDTGMMVLYYYHQTAKAPVIEFYDGANNKSLGCFVPDVSRGNYWAISQDGKYIATVSRGGPIRIWDVAEVMKNLLTS
ncbi:MAG: WD40 repeat domain-containing protein [Pirellulales bacterium]